MTVTERRGEGYGFTRSQMYRLRMDAPGREGYLVSQVPLRDTACRMVNRRSGQLRQGVSGLRQQRSSRRFALLHALRAFAVSEQDERLRLDLFSKPAEPCTPRAVRTEIGSNRQVFATVHLDAAVNEWCPALPAVLSIGSDVLVPTFHAFLKLHVDSECHGLTSLAQPDAFTPMTAVRRARDASLEASTMRGVAA